MRKYRGYAGMLLMSCFCLLAIGCGKGGRKPDRVMLTGGVKCMLCADGQNSFKSMYGGHPGVALFCLRDRRMIQIQPSADEEIKNDFTSHVWADAYSVQVDRMPERGVSLIQYISYERDILDLDELCEVLCPACMENVKEAVKEKAVCLVDLSTMEIYGIQYSFQYYMLEDYYVQAICQEDKIRLTVFQTSRDPERL